MWATVWGVFMFLLGQALEGMKHHICWVSPQGHPSLSVISRLLTSAVHVHLG